MRIPQANGMNAAHPGSGNTAGQAWGGAGGITAGICVNRLRVVTPSQMKLETFKTS